MFLALVLPFHYVTVFVDDCHLINFLLLISSFDTDGFLTLFVVMDPH